MDANNVFSVVDKDGVIIAAPDQNQHGKEYIKHSRMCVFFGTEGQMTILKPGKVHFLNLWPTSKPRFTLVAPWRTTRSPFLTTSFLVTSNVPIGPWIGSGQCESFTYSWRKDFKPHNLTNGWFSFYSMGTSYLEICKCQVIWCSFDLAVARGGVQTNALVNIREVLIAKIKRAIAKAKAKNASIWAAFSPFWVTFFVNRMNSHIWFRLLAQATHLRTIFKQEDGSTSFFVSV